jgi:hypothetical protein
MSEKRKRQERLIFRRLASLAERAKALGIPVPDHIDARIKAHRPPPLEWLRAQERRLHPAITKAEGEHQDRRRHPRDRSLRRKLDAEAARATGVKLMPKRRAWVVSGDPGTLGPASRVRHIDPSAYEPQQMKQRNHVPTSPHRMPERRADRLVASGKPRTEKPEQA